jgi:hypothetical protein
VVRGIVGRAREWAEERRGPILLRERPLWADTHHLYDVAGRTAQWLAGELRSQPGYFGPCDVDEDDAPGLTDCLIACNRAGFLTSNSQAGFDGTGYDGAHWQQLAAVTGFAHRPVVEKLRALNPRYGFLAHEGVGSRWHRAGGLTVTWAGGREYTEFGAQTNQIDFLYEGCGDAAIADIERAFQVTICDLIPGRNTLWADLHAAVTR